MQNIKSANASTSATGTSAVTRSPTDIARDTLRALTVRKLAPTPDSYQRVYEEISGTQGQHADGTLEPLLGTLRDLQKSSAALKGPATRLQHALVNRNWKAFGTELQALSIGDNPEDPAPAAGLPDQSAGAPRPPASAGAASSDAIGWPDTIRKLLGQHQLRHATVSPRQKHEGLERVLGSFGRSPRLPDKLYALVQSWGAARPGSGNTEVGTADIPRVDAAGIDIGGSEPVTTVEPDAVARAAGALAADALTGGVLTGPAESSVQSLRRLLAGILRKDLAARYALDPDIGAMLAEMSELAERADTSDACAELSQRLAEFREKAEASGSHDGHLVPDLMGLVRLVVDNIGELVDDDQWMGGQVAVMRQLMSQPPTAQMLNDAQQRFREIILRQGTLKHSLADAKNTLKDLIAVFVERLGGISQSTADYHQKIGLYAEQIERTADIGSLRVVLDGLMVDMRSMQVDAQRSRDEVAAAREQAQSAESKIRQLENELEEISEKVREDALTGSLNRRGLDEALVREAARAERYGNSLCVAVLDLDNFKALNDTHGHHAGDGALVHLVKVVKSLLRPSDSIGRFGGEEFVILLPETTPEAGKQVIERLQRELTKQFFLANNEKLLITFSAGVARLRSGESEALVVRRADEAMYEAKRAGKNRVFLAD